MPSRPKTNIGDFVANARPASKSASRKGSRVVTKLASSPKSPVKPELRALTVRLDVDRWLRLREFSLHDGRSANQIIVELLDRYLDPRLK